MNLWDPNGYLRFIDERTRPSIDLVSRIAIESPSSVIDLGCGPGNSTRVLQQRWPSARVIGLDSSAQMINAAIEEYPDREWIHSAIEDWLPTAAFHVVFSNAALQWLAEPRRLSWRLQLLRGWSHEQHIKAVSS